MYCKDGEKRTNTFRGPTTDFYYVKPGATGLISRGRDEKISEFR